jgi:FkbM family methyltransferase
MLIDLKEVVKKYNLNLKGIIQIGVHYAEEHSVLLSIGAEKIVYIEPCKDAYETMVCNISDYMQLPQEGILISLSDSSYYSCVFNQNKLQIKCFMCACADYEGQTEMFTSKDNQGQSNSILQPHLHLAQHKEIVFNEKENVFIVKLDNLPFDKKDYQLLMMDVQGAEGLVLKGAPETLKHIDCIYTEVNRDYTYEGNMLIDEMDEYLYNFGFVRVETYWPSPNWSWGDAIYLKQIA